VFHSKVGTLVFTKIGRQRGRHMKQLKEGMFNTIISFLQRYKRLYTRRYGYVIILTINWH